MIIRPRRESDRPDMETLKACLQEHLYRLPRLERLRAYYCGKHDILRRVRDSGLPNNRLIHGFPRYISVMAAGYLIGSPVSYLTDQENPSAVSALNAVISEYQACDMDSVDAELAKNASVFGRSVELVFANEAARPRSAVLNPEHSFVVYDDTVECRPLFGVYFAPVRRSNGETEGWRVNVFTPSRQIVLRAANLADLTSVSIESDKPHYFGGVPMIEYWNNEDETGDFENVLSLIDAYDLLESDRINDKQQFVDALLLLYGCTMEIDARGRTPGQQLREDKALALPDSDARVEWLCKQMNESDTEILKSALKDDIHKMSLVPDLTDENFAGNASGVAMRYKLLGLEQLTKIKERWFREGLRNRLRLYGSFMRCLGGYDLEANGVRILFTRALPVNELENAQMLNALNGIVSPESLAARADALLGMK